MSQRRIVLVASADADDRLENLLTVRGWSVERCGGPGESTCPLPLGDGCRLLEGADASIVHFDPLSGPSLSSHLLKCVAASVAPSIVLLEGREDPPQTFEGTGIMGGRRPDEEIISAVDRLIG